MTHLDDLAVLLELGCLTGDRSDAEQDALLRVAAKVDAEANALTVSNHREGHAWRWYQEVANTRDPQRFSRANPKTLTKLEAQADRWDAR